MDEKLQKELEEKIKRMEEEAFRKLEKISEENIKKSQKQLADIKTAEYLEKLNELKDKLRRCGERMKIDKERGNTAGELEEHSRYNYLVELITELKENRIKELENMFTRSSQKSEETIEDCDKKIAGLEQKAKEVAKRMRADKKYGNYAGESQAHAEFNEVIQQISDLKNKKVAIIDNKIKELEEEAANTAQVMKADREYGNFAGEAQAHSNYSKLVVEINELKKTRQNIINPNISKMNNKGNVGTKKEEQKIIQEKEENIIDDTTKSSEKKLLEEPNIKEKIVLYASDDTNLPYLIKAYRDNEGNEEEYGDEYYYLKNPKKNTSAAYIGEYYKDIVYNNKLKYNISQKMQETADPMILFYLSEINENEARNMANRIKSGEGLKAYADIINYDMTEFKNLGFFEKIKLRKIVKNAVRDGLKVKNYENTYSLWDKIVNKFKSLGKKKKEKEEEATPTVSENKKSARVDFFERLDERDTVAKIASKKNEKVTVVKHNDKKVDKNENENVI